MHQLDAAESHRRRFFLAAAAGVAILIPPNVFPGADWLDWAGLGGAVALLAFNWLQSRAHKQTAPQVAAP